ncbi:DUF2235 domain-containing protein, partial [Burkholderia pseudomallei]|nr:DUF2235 domain-containing protein [Burkholderia pseudomallei]
MRANSGVGALKLIAAEQNGVELTLDLDTNWAQLKNELDSSKWNAAVQEWDAKRRMVLLDRRAQLKARIGDLLVNGKPNLQRIRLYVFAFSRCASHALSFSH